MRQFILGTKRYGAKLLLSLVMAVSTHSLASAQVENEMNDFFDKLNTAANVTGPSSADGQQAGYYTLGNVYLRNRVETLQPASIQLPSIRAGCGGIDVFAGGFSFVNSDQLVAFMKSVANNAASFAFQVALETISPVISEKVGELQSLANKVNQFNMNSCSEAQAIVGTIWNQSDKASALICQSKGVKDGLFADWASARHNCGSQGQVTSTNSNPTPAEDAQLPDKNIAWEALKSTGADVAYREFLMTLTGTAILRPGADDDAERTWEMIPAMLSDSATLSTLLDGGELRIYKCDEVEKCLNPSPSTETLSESVGLTAKVKGHMSSILAKIESRTELSAEEKQFLNLTTMPVYKILSVHHAYTGVFAESVSSYSEIIAVDLLFALTNEFVEDINDAQGTAAKGLESQLNAWRNSLVAQREILYSHQLSLQSRLQTVDQIIASTRGLERQLAGRLSRDVADAYYFSAATSQ